MPTYNYNPDQYEPGVVNTIIQTGRKRGLTDDHILTALATGVVESGLRNLGHGHGSSVGWRQEVAKYYGSKENRMNVQAATDRFYDELSGTPRKNSLGAWAQAVQRSAHPERYDQAMGVARQVLQEFGGGAAGGGSGGQSGQGGQPGRVQTAGQPQRYGPSGADVTGRGEQEPLVAEPQTDSRSLLTAVIQSVSDQIAGRGSTEGMIPASLGPEPEVVPDEQLEPDALDGLGEQGGGIGTPGQTPEGPQAQPPSGGGAPDAGGWALPTSGRWSSNFGQDRGSHKHGGVDISAPAGTPIVAAQGGTVSRAGWSDSYGWVVYIEHEGGVQTRYAHMVGKPNVNVGDRVTSGQGIGGVGNTGRSKGNHLHYEVRVNGKSVDPNGYHGVSGRFAEV